MRIGIPIPNPPGWRQGRRRLLVTLAAAGLALTGVALPQAAPAAADSGLDPASVEPLKTQQDEMVLRYDEPANDWQSRSLPIGNGAMGASVFGGVGQDSIQLNEKSLWSGGPGSPGGYDYGNHDLSAGLKLVQDRITEQGSAPNGWAIGQLGQPKLNYGSYLALGKLELTVPGTEGYTGYERSLDLDRALAKTTYTVGETTYTRQYLASYPANVVAVRITAAKADGSATKGAVDLSVGYTDQLGANAAQATTTASGDTLVYSGSLTNGLRFDSRTQVVAEGGQVSAEASSITVTGADAVTLYWSGATDYSDSYEQGYRNGVDPATTTSQRVQAAATAGWQAVQSAHESDYQALFSRMRLDLDADKVTSFTDDALGAYQGRGAPDRALETLYTQFGRYLLIASSRDSSPLPANLQGVWANSSTPPWSSDYHVNINLQMNYWPAYSTNLGETAQPYERFVSSLVAPGEVSAQQLFGYAPGTSGWVVFNETTPYGYTGVYDWPTASWFPEAGAWVANTFWQNYLYTGDVEHLRSQGYPVLKGASRFWLNFLVDAGDGTLVVSPSYSPEHGQYSAGAAMSQQIVTELLTTTLQAAEVTGETDAAFVQQVREALAKLQPGLRVGSRGQLQEWIQDWDYSPGWGGDEPDHRHTSQLYALFPGQAIDPLTDPATQAYADAARQTLVDRGDGGTGWSKAWKINFWANLADGDHSHLMLTQILRQSTYANLWDAHPPFQIDGNFGATAGVAQMLVQSKNGVTRLLPALPTAWASGSVDGLRGHGGLTVGATWRDGAPTQVRLQADSDGERLLDGDLLEGLSAVVDTTADTLVTPVKDATTGAWRLSMSAGHVYVVVPTGSVRASTPSPSISWGQATTVSVQVEGAVPSGSTLALTAPEGWTVAEGPVSVEAPGTFTFNVTSAVGTAGTVVLEATLTSGRSSTSARTRLEVVDPAVIPQSSMRIVDYSSQETSQENGAAANLLDGDPSTYWHSDWSTTNPRPPHHVTVDLGAVEKLASMTWTPRSNTGNGLVKDYELWAATDEGCTQFTQVTQGSWPDNRSARTIELEGTSARCLKLVSTSEAWVGSWATGAELTARRVVDPVAAPQPPAAEPLTGQIIAWSDQEADSTEHGHPLTAVMAADGEEDTYWHSSWSSSTWPHWIVLDLGSQQDLTGVVYTSRPTSQPRTNGTLAAANVYVLAEAPAQGWVTGGFGAPAATVSDLPDGSKQSVTIPVQARGRYVVLEGTAATNGGAFAAVSELKALKAAPSQEPDPAPDPVPTPAPEPSPSTQPSVDPGQPEPGQPEGTMPAYVAAVVAGGSGQVLMGDWDGDGTPSYAVRVGSRVVFYNDNHTGAPVYAAVSIGRAGDEVLVGDWDGDGRDTLALRRGAKVMTQDALTSTATTKVVVEGLTRSSTLKIVLGQAGAPDTLVVG